MYGPKLQFRKLIPLIAVLQVGAAEPAVAQGQPADCPGELEILVERSFAARAGISAEGDGFFETWQRRTER